MKGLIIALVLVLVCLIDGPAFAQGGCEGSCSYSKSVCLQNTRNNQSICGAAFSECMSSGTWMIAGRYRIYLPNRCKR